MYIGTTGRVVFDDGSGYLSGGGVSVSNDVQASSGAVNCFSVRCEWSLWLSTLRADNIPRTLVFVLSNESSDAVSCI
jgi:hypothetical protein